MVAAICATFIRWVRLLHAIFLAKSFLLYFRYQYPLTTKRTYLRMTDEQLLIGIRDKDPGAFDAVFERWYRKLCYFANKIINEQAAAKDIVTDSFVKLWIKKKEFSSIDHLEAFIFKTIKNSCLDHLHKNEYRTKIEKEVVKSGPVTEDAIAKKYFQSEIIEALYSQINQLPERTQQVFRLTYLEGHSVLKWHNCLTSLKTQYAI